MTKPKISVLMPVYNTELFIAEAIESILSQTLPDFELIIVNDGSSDNSLAIAEKYSSLDSRISLYSQLNCGISKTRNHLISLANCDYIAWMDSDDVSLPTRLKKQFKCLQDDSKLLAIGSGTLLIDDKNMKICRWDIPSTHKEIDNWHINGKGGAIIFASTMMLKQAVINIGGFDPKVTGAEDLCLFLRLAEIGKLQNTSEILYYYRQHLNSISHVDKQKIRDDKQIVIDNACERRGLKSKKFNLEQKSTELTDTYIKWGWWALNGKNVSTSRKYAIKALLAKPLDLHAWKLFACSVRGY